MTVVKVPCPSHDQIAQRIQDLLAEPGDALAPEPPLELSLETARPGVLLLRLRRGAAFHERALLLSSADCEALPKAVVQVAKEWQQASWEALAAQAAAAVVPGPAPADPAPDEAEAAPDPEPAAPPFPSAPAHTLPPPAKSRSALRFSLVGGAFHWVGEPHAGPGVAASLDCDVAPLWGLGVLGGFDGPVTARIARARGHGSIAVSVAHFDLLVRYSLLATNWGRLELLAGPGARVLFASARSFSSNRKRTHLTPTGTLRLDFRIPLSERLAADVVLAGSLAPHGDVFQVRYLDGTLRVPPAQVSAQTGLTYSFP